MKKVFKFILPAASIVTAFSAVSLSSCHDKSHLRLSRDDWESNTKTALNECIANYGVDGKYYSKDNYVVFDFDNTSAIFDIAHQCTTYQIERMAFNLTKDELVEALSADLGFTRRSLTDYGYDFTYETLINDIATCYENLQTKYGPFSYKGVAEDKLSALHAETDWQNFAGKLRYLFSVVSVVQGDTERCKWGTYQYSGMTPEQVYDLEYRCLSHCSTLDSKRESWVAPDKISGSSTIASASFLQGISVTENIKELYKALNDNGIDIWIVSASQIDQVRAAADVFGLGQYVKGIFALTNKLGDSGTYIPKYDMNGKGYLRQNNQWVKTEKSNTNVTSGVGKSLTIVDSIAPNYNNKGPIMCFGDSTGDFNFCTEFASTKLVVCFNRADRSVYDGGGLLSAIAMYQQDNNITLAKANENGDTLYCLQGRDETGKRCFRNSNKTIILGESEEKLFRHEDNYTMLNYIKNNKLSVHDAFNKLCIENTKIDGIYVGFLLSYLGYHSR